jgi:hypothetical protein
MTDISYYDNTMTGYCGGRERCMAKFIRLVLFFILVVNPLLPAGQDDSNIDIQKGDEAFSKEDYYSALVFYARAMGAQDVTDGIIWYKTAYSWERIKTKDPRDPFLETLYTISFYYLIEKQPEHEYIDKIKTRLNLSLKVNNQLIKRTRMELAGRMLETGDVVPRFSIESIRNEVTGWALFFRDSTSNKMDRTLLPWKSFKSGGLESGIRTLFQNWETIILFWIIVCFPTGVILPFIIANYRASRGKPKGLFEAYLLWFHWGSLGIHRFYLGQYGMGFLMLFTFGGLGVGWLVEGIFLGINHKKTAGSGAVKTRRAPVGGTHGRSQVQAVKQVSRRKPAEDNFDDFNILSSGEEL